MLNEKDIRQFKAVFIIICLTIFWGTYAISSYIDALRETIDIACTLGFNSAKLFKGEVNRK